MAKYSEDAAALTPAEQIQKDVQALDPTAKVEILAGRVISIDAPGLSKAQLDSVLNGRLTRGTTK